MSAVCRNISPVFRRAVQRKSRGCRLQAMRLCRHHQTLPAINHCLQNGVPMATRSYSNEAIPPPQLDGEVNYPEKITGIVEQISSLTIAEVADLNKLLKQTLGIQEAPVMAIGMATAPAAAPEVDDDEEVTAAPKAKTSFTVKLVKFDETSKVKLIKQIKVLTSGMNLVQAKKFVESAPQVVKADVSKTEAEEIQKQIEEAGGSCEIE